MGLKGYIHASEILTGEGVRKKNGRRVLESDLGRIVDGAIIYSTKKVGIQEIADTIEWVGATRDLPEKYSRVKKINLTLGLPSTMSPPLSVCSQKNQAIPAGYVK